MELKEFVKKVISDAVEAVDESSSLASRKIVLAQTPDRRTIEFDVAVSAEEKETTEGKAGVKVLSFMEAGANMGVESKNSTVSRITFGVNVSSSTKAEESHQQEMYRQVRDKNRLNNAR